ncbi:MAG: FAD-dependent oxidoreductase [Bdellovibrionia bacterium]
MRTSMQILTTLGISREVQAVFTPETISELVSKYSELKSQHKSISVVSRGNNWGYGCRAPIEENGLLIDLSRCAAICEFDSYHGTVTLEPGVSYGQLAAFLKEQGGQWIAPVHGGGPDCSVIGNALERGYGITPYTDHFGAVLTLEAILENGTLYEGSLKKLGQEKLDKLFKYGVGPYYDGVFTQSGVGIVTKMTIKLAPKPKYIEMFYFALKDDTQIKEVVEATKISKRDLGSILGGINLMNRERCLSMLADYPLEKIKNAQPLDDNEVRDLAMRYQAPHWMIAGTLYGDKALVKAAKKRIKENFKSVRKRQFYFNSTNKKIVPYVGKLLNAIGLTSVKKSLDSMSMGFDIINGTPNNVALKLAYWKHEDKDLVKNENLNPNRDGCGLIWYAPLVEMKPDVVVSYIDFVNEAARKFNMNPLITLTTVDDLCYDSTVPIVFNMQSEQDREIARTYFEYLFAEGARRGFFPYRFSIETQKKLNIQNPLLKPASVNPSRYQ